MDLIQSTSMPSLVSLARDIAEDSRSNRLLEMAELLLATYPLLLGAQLAAHRSFRIPNKVSLSALMQPKAYEVPVRSKSPIKGYGDVGHVHLHDGSNLPCFSRKPRNYVEFDNGNSQTER